MKVTFLDPIIQNSLLKKRVCAYARVSTSKDDQANSFENQQLTYENKIKANPNYEYVGIFADKGISGTTENRPAFQEMLRRCRAGEIDLILTKSVSRFARDTTSVLKYVRELKKMGVEVHFEEQKIQTMSKDGELMLTVFSAFAQEESWSVSQNIKWTVRKKFERGEGYLNTKRFLGYDKDIYGDLIINQEEAALVKCIFNEYLEGKGSHTLAKMLNEEGVQIVTGAKWSDNTILYILKNEKYRRDALLQKTYTPNCILRLFRAAIPLCTEPPLC